MDISYALDYPVIAGTKPQRVHLMVRIETWPKEGGAQRKPLNLALILDRSGSMAGGKLAATQEAACALVKRLSREDILSVVAYDTNVEVILPPGRVNDAQFLHRCIRSINAGGVTNLSGGWIRGLSLVAEHASPERLNRVLLLTDGQANEGVTEAEGLMEIARQYFQQNIITTTLGFGEEFNEDILTAIAREGGGHFYFIDSQEQASSAFLREFGDLIRIFGQNCELTLTPGEGMPMPNLVGAGGERIGDTLSVKLGDVRDQDLRQSIFAFDLSEKIASQTRELATITVCYDAVRGKIGPRRHILSAKIKVDPENATSQPVAAVECEVILGQVAQFKQKAIEKLDQGDMAAAQNHIQRAQELLHRHSSLSPEKFSAENENIRRLLRVTTGENSLLRKQLSSQNYDFSTQRGNYQGRPQTDVKVFTLTPNTPEVVGEIAEYLRNTLKTFEYRQPSIENMEFALRELVENALEHGIKGVIAPQCEVELYLARNYAKIVVRDNGPGFNFPAVLREEEQQAKDEASGHRRQKRGRGLLSVRKLLDTLDANTRGNELTAVIRKERFAASTNFDVIMDSQGVGEVAVVKVSGFLDANSHQKIEGLFQEILSRGIYKLIVDLSECDYISSCGAGTLMEAISTVLENNGSMVLVSPAGNVKRTLDCLGLASLFPFALSIEEAKRLM